MSRISIEEKKERHKVAVKKWQQKNVLKRKGYKKKWEKANPEKVKEANRRRNERYRIKHRERIREANLRYRNKDRELFNKKVREYERSRKNDVRYQLLKRLRIRLSDAIRGKFKDKAGSAVKLLGCSIEELKFYLEGQFKDGMTWDNYGSFGWHIDHKIPLSYYDLSDIEQLKKACHYTNLQPLWWQENLSKGKKILININQNYVKTN